MNPPPLPPPLYTPGPPPFPPPGGRNAGWRWIFWIAASAGLPVLGFLSNDINSVIGFSLLAGLLGVVASGFLAATMASPSKDTGRFLGLSILFAMGSGGMVLAVVFAGCLLSVR